MRVIGRERDTQRVIMPYEERESKRRVHFSCRCDFEKKKICEINELIISTPSFHALGMMEIQSKYLFKAIRRFLYFNKDKDRLKRRKKRDSPTVLSWEISIPSSLCESADCQPAMIKRWKFANVDS